MRQIVRNVYESEQPDEFVIRPDPLKWGLIAAVMAVLTFASLSGGLEGDNPMENLGITLLPAMTLVFALMATGQMSWIKAGPKGLRVQNFFVRREYAWHEITAFQAKAVGTGFNRQKVIVFSRYDKTGALASVNKFIGGGTEQFPVIGLRADKLKAFLNTKRNAELTRTGYAHLIHQHMQPEHRRAEDRPQRVEAPQSKPYQQPLQPGRPSAMQPRDPIDKRQKPLIS